MKSLFMALITMLLVSNAFASGVTPGNVALSLTDLKIEKVGRTGKVLKSTHHHPYSNFLIAIPAVIVTKDVCTNFVGQKSSSTNDQQTHVITAVGAFDSTVDACIQVLPAPIKTNLTFNMSVVTGGFVAADPIQTQTVEFTGLGSYTVQLDMSSNKVTLKKAVLAEELSN